jgi:hypothetical protein
MGCGFYRQAYKELRVSDSIGFKIERKSTCPTGGKLIHRLPSSNQSQPLRHRTVGRSVGDRSAVTSREGIRTLWLLS